MVAIRWGAVAPQGWRLDLTHLTDPVAQFDAMVGVAREAETLGFDSVWLYDHLQPVSGAQETTFECWTSLAAMARETSRVRLGQLVTCNSYRNPTLVAKMAATLDAASGGRAFLGLGAGWDQREYEAYGYPAPYPSTGERLRRLGEAAQVITAMLRTPKASVEGEFHRVQQAVNVPTGVQKPHIPLLIGGSGENVTLRLVAEHADACNLTDHTDPGFYRHKLGVLAQHCERIGRDYSSILKTATLSVFTAPDQAGVTRLLEPHLHGRSREELAAGSAVGTPDKLVEIFGALIEAGIEYFILYFHEPTDPEPMRLFASEIMPRLAR
ncbi:TIGR03560 family F420-dependent LLM class oxidoreductase [Streptomyces sp. NPDC126933]|uniref:TIGR03560 family F420-dependent LLM class oxidoreductase n=1 Tax=unclassified Streptomyces TaxID=2593676 RepID=UPI003663FC42